MPTQLLFPLPEEAMEGYRWDHVPHPVDFGNVPYPFSFSNHPLRPSAGRTFPYEKRAVVVAPCDGLVKNMSPGRSRNHSPVLGNPHDMTGIEVLHEDGTLVHLIHAYATEEGEVNAGDIVGKTLKPHIHMVTFAHNDVESPLDTTFLNLPSQAHGAHHEATDLMMDLLFGGLSYDDQRWALRRVRGDSKNFYNAVVEYFRQGQPEKMMRRLVTQANRWHRRHLREATGEHRWQKLTINYEAFVEKYAPAVTTPIQYMSTRA